MSRKESVIVGIFLAFMVPLTLAVLGWWVTAVVYLYRLYSLREAAIANGALLGFGAGILLTILYLKSWIKRFYTVDLRFMVFVYLLWSFMMIAFFMGLPLGNVLLGVVAGIYFGRRMHHAGLEETLLKQGISAAARFAAFVTGSLTLFVGILSLFDPFASASLESMLGLQRGTITRPLLIAVVFLATVVLVLLQYVLTRAAAAISASMGKDTGSSA